MLFADEPDKWRGWTIDISDGRLRLRHRSCPGGRLQPVRVSARARHHADDPLVRGMHATAGGSRNRFARTSVHAHNLLESPPHPGSFDIVLCRNVLLYLCSEKKALAFDRLATAMGPDGYLMLGAGETVIGQTKKLASDASARGLYRLDGRDKSDRRTIAERRAAARG